MLSYHQAQLTRMHHSVISIVRQTIQSMS